MNSNDRTDRHLGMGRRITRRDFVNGVGVAVGSTMLPQGATGQDVAPQQSPDYYPPALTGMRGSHPGSFETAHDLRDRRSVDLSAAIHTNESYDLVIVGAGMSGLGAACFFLKAVGRNVKVLLLDNHDDFGGHAKRNEFRYNGHLLAINGGTLNVEAPLRYNEPAKDLLHDIGVDLDRFQTTNAGNRNLYRSLGLGSAYFFDKETWGKDQLIANRDGERLAEAVVEAEGFPRDLLAKMPLT